jgi:hypothetical protein
MTIASGQLTVEHLSGRRLACLGELRRCEHRAHAYVALNARSRRALDSVQLRMRPTLTRAMTHRMVRLELAQLR